MSIIGIDYEKCNNCSICLTACILFRRDKDKDKILFNNSSDFCNLCGHCIARCPQDAIVYENIEEAYAYEGVDKPETLVSYETIYKFLRANRSVRRYKKEKVPKDVLMKVFEAMRHAPTGGNRRTERFSIISDTEKLKKLSDAVQEELLKDPVIKKEYEKIFIVLRKVFESPVYFDAPHVIFVDSIEESKIEANNMGIIITYGRLAAQTLGLGTCWNGWTQMAMNINPDIRKLANLKGNSIGAFMIGYPAVKFYRSPPRSPKKVYGLE